MDTSKTETIYKGSICLKCHKRAMSKAFWRSTAGVAFLLLEILFLFGAGDARLRELGPQMNLAMRDAVQYVIQGGVLLAHGLHHHPFAGLRLFAVLGSFIAIPCLLVWMGWQWKLARHGIGSKLQRPYSAWETVMRKFRCFASDRSNGVPHGWIK